MVMKHCRFHIVLKLLVFTTMHINKAFIKGEMTFNLYGLIMRKLIESNENGLTSFFIRNRLLSMILSWNFLVLNQVFDKQTEWIRGYQIFLILISAGLFTFFSIGFMYGLMQNWRFERFYNAFLEHMGVSSVFSMDVTNLEGAVLKRLKDLAHTLERVELKYSKMSQHVSKARQRLSDAHAFFLKLGLCEKYWGIYFEKSE